jgi:hypothetical protein
MSQIRAQELVWPGQIQAFASLQTAKRISAHVIYSMLYTTTGDGKTTE